MRRHLILVDTQAELDAAPARDVSTAEVIVMRLGLRWRVLKSRRGSALAGWVFDTELDALRAAL